VLLGALVIAAGTAFILTCLTIPRARPARTPDFQTASEPSAFDPTLWEYGWLRRGAPAPQFSLPDVTTGAAVSLNDFHGTPVVLLFGSFT
jgi:hypothetical protein